MTDNEDVHQCRSCDQKNDTHSLGCPMHPDYDPDRNYCPDSSLLNWGMALREGTVVTG